MITVYFFPNGNVTVCGQDGRQIFELEKSYVELFCEFLESKGYKPEDAIFNLPSGEEAEIFKTMSGWNWEIKGRSP